MNDFYRYQLMRVKGRLDHFALESAFFGTVLYVIFFMIYPDVWIPTILSVLLSVVIFRFLVGRSIGRSLTKGDEKHVRSLTRKVQEESIPTVLPSATPEEREPPKRRSPRETVAFETRGTDQDTGE